MNHHIFADPHRSPGYAPVNEIFEYKGSAKPDRKITVGGVRMLLSPRGQINTNVTSPDAFLRVKATPAPTKLALNSDRYVEYAQPHDTFTYFPPGSSFKAITENHEPVLLMQITPDTINEWFRSVDKPQPWHSEGLPYRHDPVIGRLGFFAASTMSDQGFGKQRADKLIAEAIVTRIWSRLLTASQTETTPPEEEMSNWARMKDEARLKKAIDYAMDNLTDPSLKIADMAAEAGLSAPHFGEVFKRFKGATPYAFILQQRLEKARGLVVSTYMSLSEIAHATGFSSQSHMTSCFSKHFGISPARMRRQS